MLIIAFVIQMYSHFIIPFILLHFILVSGEGNNSNTINIAGFYSSNDGIWRSEVVRTIADFAVNMINSDPTILGDYVLNVTWKDSQCERQASVDKFLEIVGQKYTIYHFIFGPSCSRSVESLGELSSSYFLNILTPTATSPTLTNNNIYPNILLGVPTSSNLVVIYMELIEMFTWRRVGIVHEDAGLFDEVYDLLSDQLKEKNIIFDTERIVNSSDFDGIDEKLERLFVEKRYKVIIANLYEKDALSVFCRAYKKNYYYPHVTWVIPARFTNDWLHNVSTTCCCNRDEIIQFLQGALGVDIVVRLDNHTFNGSYTKHIFKPHEDTVFGIRRDKLWDNILEYSIKRKEDLDPNVIKYALYAFDSMITLAYLFDKALKDGNTILTDFNYHRKDRRGKNGLISTTLADGIDKIRFSGLTGNVSYSNRARELAPAEIVEFVDGLEELRGVLPLISLTDANNVSTYKSNIELVHEFKYFGKGGSGNDGAELHQLPVEGIVIAITFALVAFLYTLFFFFINTIHYKHKVISLSSPILNAAILTGGVINCVVAVIVVLDNRVFERTPEDVINGSACIYCTFFCHLAWWMPALATDIIFGTLVGKSFVVYRVAKDKSFRFSKNSIIYILLFVSILMTADTLFTIVWALIPQIRLEFIAHGPYETPSQDIRKTGAPYWYLFFCAEGGNLTSLAVGVRYVYIFLRWILYGVGLYYASQIRKFTVSGVHEFQAVSHAIVTSVFFNLARVVLVTTVLSVRITDAATTLLSLSYSVDTCIIISHIFIPKLFYIIKDPEEERDYAGVHNTKEIDTDSYPQMRIKKINREIAELKTVFDNLEEKVLERKLVLQPTTLRKLNSTPDKENLPVDQDIGHRNESAKVEQTEH